MECIFDYPNTRSDIEPEPSRLQTWNMASCLVLWRKQIQPGSDVNIPIRQRTWAEYDLLWNFFALKIILWAMKWAAFQLLEPRFLAEKNNDYQGNRIYGINTVTGLMLLNAFFVFWRGFMTMPDSDLNAIEYLWQMDKTWSKQLNREYDRFQNLSTIKHRQDECKWFLGRWNKHVENLEKTQTKRKLIFNNRKIQLKIECHIKKGCLENLIG